MHVHARDAEADDRVEIRLERARDRARLALVPHEHLERRLDARGRERSSDLVESARRSSSIAPARSLRIWITSKPCSLREADLVGGRPPVEREEPPDHPDAHG